MAKKDSVLGVVVSTINDALGQVNLGPATFVVKPAFWVLMFLGIMGPLLTFGVGGAADIVQLIGAQIYMVADTVVTAAQGLFGWIFGDANAMAVVIEPAVSAIPVDPLPVFESVGVPEIGGGISNALPAGGSVSEIQDALIK